MLTNPYFYRARLFPALITSIPMLIFVNKIIAVQYADALKNVYDILPFIAHFGLSGAIIFLCIQINRIVAKEIFQRFHFREELFMPTTNHLLISNTYYPIPIKDKIRNKIKKEFKIVLADAQSEAQNENDARKLISTAVSQIRNVLRGDNLLLQHNIEYGFWRNLIGGSLIAVIFAIAIYWYGAYNKLEDQIITGVICFILYLIPIVLSRYIIHRYGNYYSKILYEQFLSMK